jgi:hypothetical protein
MAPSPRTAQHVRKTFLVVKLTASEACIASVPSARVLFWDQRPCIVPEERWKSLSSLPWDSGTAGRIPSQPHRFPARRQHSAHAAHSSRTNCRRRDDNPSPTPRLWLIKHVRDNPTEIKKPHCDVGSALSCVDVGLSGVAGEPSIR